MPRVVSRSVQVPPMPLGSGVNTTPDPSAIPGRAAAYAANSAEWILRLLKQFPNNPLHRKLKHTLEPFFHPIAERVESPDKNAEMQRLAEVCWGFAYRKYQAILPAIDQSRHLGAAASHALFSTGPWVLDPIQVAQRIVKQYEQDQHRVQRDLERFGAIAERQGISTRLRQPIERALKEKLHSADPVLPALQQFLSHPKIRPFLDKRGEIRKKKLGGITAARVDLVEAFTNLPATLKRMWGTLWEDDLERERRPRSLSLNDAYALTAECLKAYFPDRFPPHYDADSVKHAYLYHRRNRRLPSRRKS